MLIDIQTSKELIQMETDKMMTYESNIIKIQDLCLISTPEGSGQSSYAKLLICTR